MDPSHLNAMHSYGPSSPREATPAGSDYETADEHADDISDDISDGGSESTASDIRDYLNDVPPRTRPEQQQAAADPVESDDGDESQRSEHSSHRTQSEHSKELGNDVESSDYSDTSEHLVDNQTRHGGSSDHGLDVVDLTSDVSDVGRASRMSSPGTTLDDLEEQYRENRNREEREDGLLAGHSGQCYGSSGPSTPDESRSRTPAIPDCEIQDSGTKGRPAKRQKTGPKMASLLMADFDAAGPIVSRSDLSQDQRDHRTLHHKARSVKPNIELPGNNRVWIGVLNPNVKISNVRKESDFIWMKGHGGNTMKTIWHHWHAQAAADSNYKLQINDEFPSETTIMAELDFYNDKHVIFRPVLQFNLAD